MRVVRLGRNAARLLRGRRAGLYPHVCRAGFAVEHGRVEAALLAELAPCVSRGALAAGAMGRGRPLVDEVLPHASAGAAAGRAARALRARAALHAGASLKRKPRASAEATARARSGGDVSYEGVQ